MRSNHTIENQFRQRDHRKRFVKRATVAAGERSKEDGAGEGDALEDLIGVRAGATFQVGESVVRRAAVEVDDLVRDGADGAAPPLDNDSEGGGPLE